MATIVWDATGERLHGARRRPARCAGAPTPPVSIAAARSRRAAARATARCRAAGSRRLAAGVGVGVAVAGALALGLVPGSDAPASTEPVGPMRPVAASTAPGADPEVGGTYRAIDRALAGEGDVGGLVAGLEGAAGE